MNVRVFGGDHSPWVNAVLLVLILIASLGKNFLSVLRRSQRTQHDDGGTL